MMLFWLLQTPNQIQGKYFFEINANLSTRQINQLYSMQFPAVSSPVTSFSTWEEAPALTSPLPVSIIFEVLSTS